MRGKKLLHPFPRTSYNSWRQKCKAGNSLIRSFRSNQLSDWEWFAQIARQMRTVSKSLRSLISKERPWANRSGRSPKMRESLLHSVFRQKRAIRSESRWANSQPCKNVTISCNDNEGSNARSLRCLYCIVLILVQCPFPIIGPRKSQYTLHSNICFKFNKVIL